jgi:hypothetical protein
LHIERITGCRSFLMRAVVFLTVGLGISGLAEGIGSEQETNLDRMTLAVDSAARECMVRCRLHRGDSVLLSGSEPFSALSKYVLSRFCIVLQRRGVSVLFQSDSVFCGNRLSLSLSKGAVEYESIQDRKPGNRVNVDRTAFLELAVRFQSSVNDTIEVDTLRVRCKDRIPKSALDFVERDGLLLKKPARPKAGAVIRFLEPAAALIAMGWLVYAFYSIRSK